MIWFIQSGFPGHLNDAHQFALMDQPGTDLEFSNNCYLIGDKIYPNRGNVTAGNHVITKDALHSKI